MQSVTQPVIQPDDSLNGLRNQFVVGLFGVDYRKRKVGKGSVEMDHLGVPYPPLRMAEGIKRKWLILCHTSGC